MKNNRIIRAYDSINPSPYDKAKMLDAILAQANLEEKPEPPRKRREPTLYTAKATKTSRRGILGGLAACLAVFVIGGAVLLQLGNAPEGPAYVDPTETASYDRSAQDHYAPVLEKYRRAAAEGWTKEQCEIEGISLRMQAGNDFTKLGYAFLDLDADGREELLIAEESTDRTDNIWDIYTTLEDGTPIQLWVDELTGGQCRLHEGNVISISDSYKDELEQTFYDLQAGQLVMREMLQWEDEDTVFHTDAAGSTRQVTSREGQDISNAYDIQKLELTWLAEIPDRLRGTEEVEQYTPILEKYKTALSEGWDGVMCSENGLSFYTPIESEYESLYYAMYDLNRDGINELIISEYPCRENTDTDFLEIYTVRNGSMEKIMIGHETEMRYLCEGGIVKDLTPPERGKYNAYVSFWEINQDGLFGETGAVYEIDGQWYHGFRASEKITAAEAEAEVKGLKPLYLDFIEIKSSSDGEYQSGYEAFDHIIRKYVTAITEGWTEAQCEQNDISPQILSDTCIQYNLGWCLVDIDSNGIEELVVSDGVHLFDLYVMMPHDGSPGHLVMANGGETYQLCENGVIEKHGLYSGTTAWRYYTLREIDLVQRDMVFYEGATNQYSYGTSDNDLQPIAKEKAGEIIGRDRTMELNLTPLVEAPDFLPDEIEYYEPLLNIYRQAIREDWGPGTCVENGISLMVGNYGDFVDELGYTTMDLDSNGIQELIITDGTNIYDLYTIIQDEETGPLRLVDAMERIEYFLTEDNMIYCSGSGGAGMHVYSLSSLKEDHLNMMTGFMYAPDTDPENPWFWYDGENQGDPCGWDAQPIIDNWKIIHIPFTSFE